MITKQLFLCVENCQAMDNKMRFFVFLFFCGFIVGLCSCNREKLVVVHVYDQKLTLENLQEMIPLFDENADSVEIQQHYLDTWVARQVMLHEAKKNLSSKEKKFNKQLQEYKEALLIDAYENKMVKLLLDTVVSEEELMTYVTGDENLPADVNREIIIRSILQQRKIEILKTLRKEAVRKAKESGEVLFN